MQTSLNSRSTDNLYGRRVGWLTALTVLAKVIGALYRIPLTNVIGAEAVGVYQLIFSIYALAIAATSAFHTTLISREVAAYRAMGEQEKARGYFLTTFSEGAITSALVGAILFLLGENIALAQGAAGGGLGYKVIAPAVLLVSFLSSLKGWFNGNMDLVPTAASVVIEQVVKLSVGITLALWLRDRGVVYAASAALGGVTASEAVTVLVLAVVYLMKREKGAMARIPVRQVIKEGFPLRLNGVIMPLAAFADSLIVVRLLGRFGMERGEALSAYGIYSGAVNAIVNFPVVLVLSVAIAIIPVIAGSMAMRNMETLKEKAGLTVKITLVISLPCALALAVLAPQLMSLFYPVFTEEQLALATTLMSIGAASVVFLSLTQIYAALLQSVDRAEVAAEALAVSVLVRVILMYVTVPRIGAAGIALSTLASYVLVTFLDLFKWLQYTGRAKNALKTLASVTLSGAIMLVTILAPAMLLKSAVLSLAISAAVGSVTYLFTVLKLKVFSEKELLAMPFSSITTRIGR